MSEHSTHTASFVKGYAGGFLLLLLAGSWVLSGCGESVRVLEQSSRRPYDWESQPMHPQAVWHQFHNDSLRLFLELPLAEMLYTREAATDPFRYAAKVQVAIEPRMADGRRAGTAHYHQWDLGDTAISTTALEWLHFDVPLFDGQPGEQANFWTATWVLTDLNRGVETGGEVWIEHASSHAFLVFNPALGQPFFDETVHAGQKVAMLVPSGVAEPGGTGTSGWRLDELPPATALPAPPYVRRQMNVLAFSDSSNGGVPLEPTVSSDSLYISGAAYAGWPVLMWNASPGPQRVLHKGTGLQTLHVGRSEYFPAVRDLDELIASARYVATRAEFKILENAPHPKLSFDHFWLECDPDADDARALIRTYYRRVREANTYFSGLRDGWRTDRGLVHIVFGPPDRVRRGGSYETWVYGDETNINAIIFQFRRRYRGDEFNVFDLDRSVSYRASWDARVKNWRNGRINTD